MSSLRRFAQRLAPAPPKAQYMCIRCDKVKDDVPGTWSHCTECRAIVAEIALKYPDVYLAYRRGIEAARRGRPFNKEDH